MQLILAARASGTDLAVGFDDETCVVHTVQLSALSSS